MAAGNYKITVQPPPGYSAPSTVPDAILQGLPGGPFALSTPGYRSQAFAFPAGPDLRMDIPVDEVVASVFVQKQASAARVGVGDFVG